MSSCQPFARAGYSAIEGTNEVTHRPLDTIPADELDLTLGYIIPDFDLTLDLAEQARYHSMFSFKYSPRPNTLAIKRLPDDVTEAEKTERIVRLQDLQRRIQMEHFASMVGRTFPVLADAVSRRREEELSGRTSGNTVVNFPGDASLIGSLVNVCVTGFGPNSLKGQRALDGGGPHAH